MMHPVGSLPPRVYWRRRLILLVVVLTVLLLMTQLASGLGSKNTGSALTATGGATGAGASGGAGGMGGVGRIRVDAPGTLPTTTPTGVLHRGLAFATATMAIYTVDNPMVTLLGTAGDVFDMYVIDSAGVEHTGEPQNQTIDGTGMKTMQITLLPGYNRLCATIRPGTRDKTDPFSLADKCVEVAYLP